MMVLVVKFLKWSTSQRLFAKNLVIIWLTLLIFLSFWWIWSKNLKWKKSIFLPIFQVVSKPHTSKIGSNRKLYIFPNMYEEGNHCLEVLTVLTLSDIVPYVKRLQNPLKMLKSPKQKWKFTMLDKYKWQKNDWSWSPMVGPIQNWFKLDSAGRDQNKHMLAQCAHWAKSGGHMGGFERSLNC